MAQSDGANRHNQNGTPDHRFARAVDRSLYLVSGAVAGVLAAQARARRRRAKLEPVFQVTAVPVVPVTRQPSALAQSEKVSETRAHQESDANVTVLAVLLVLLIFGALLIHIALYGFVRSSGPVGIDAATRWEVIPPRVPEPQRQFPQLQLSPQRDLREFLERQQQQLRSGAAATGDVDHARMPIERAMKMVAEHGAPKWQATGESAQALSPLELQRRRPLEAATNAP